MLRKVGLLRLRGRVLSPTRAAGDEVESVRRLRRWFGPDSGFVSILTGESVASLAATGPVQVEELATRVFSLLGDRWMAGDGERLDERGTRFALYGLRAVLTGLDLVESDGDTWSAGPSALWLLPRATGLAHLWSHSTP